MASLTGELVNDLTSMEEFKEDNIILCTGCGNEIDKEYFKDDMSLEFFNQTGRCQKCQDAVFNNEDEIRK